MNSDEKHPGLSEPIKGLRNKGVELFLYGLAAFNNFKANILHPLKTFKFFRTAEEKMVDGNLHEIIPDNLDAKLNVSSLLKASLISDATLTQEYTSDSIAEQERDKIKRFIAEFQEDNDASDAESFMTANGDMNIEHVGEDKCPSIVLPDFSFNSFVKAIQAIQSKLDAHELVIYLSPSLVNETKNECQDEIRTAAKIAPIQLTAHQPRKPMLTSIAHYVYPKFQTLLHSKVYSFFTTTFFERQKDIFAQIYGKMEVFMNVSSLFKDKGEEVSGTTKIHVSYAYHFSFKPISFLKKCNPLYAYQIQFLIHKYGIKKAALILGS
ncbi:hypothetical protein HMI54_013812 [Coelomomyces lativittatus]|nr:hypothetical protein HMI56_002214 [Coelomomyces lativittatus]KAJ1514625.1 hypothetical protein HMI54_013812 [Coelomomyces lativittatus]KAJ1516100.1 hypothetical protein HMI55_002988 [Coelomomyces lativittatus]